MKRFFDSKGDAIRSADELVIEFKENEIPFVVLELLMLEAGLTESIDFKFLEGLGLCISVNRKMIAGDKAEFRAKEEKVIAELSDKHMEYLCAFMLRTYRDGVAAVNHVHVEGEIDGRQFDLTFFFENSRPPLTSDEASRLMRR